MFSLGRTSGFNKLNTLFVPVSLPAGQWRPLHNRQQGFRVVGVGFVLDALKGRGGLASASAPNTPLAVVAEVA